MAGAGYCAVIMTIAGFYEIKHGDAFGTGVCMLVVMFGALLVRDGFYLIIGRPISFFQDPPDDYVPDPILNQSSARRKP